MIKELPILIIFLTISLSFHAQEWKQIGNDIDGENDKELFGTSVSLSSDGKTLAVSAPFSSENGKKKSGKVSVFEYENSKWKKKGKVIYGDFKRDDCGSTVCLDSSGNILAVSSQKYDGNGRNSGCVRIYNYNNNEWEQLGQNIVGDNREDRLGFISLSSDGYTIAIGASFNDINGKYSGQVKIYRFTDGKWIQLGNSINGNTKSDFFGYSLDLNSDGSVVAIGASEWSLEGSNPGRTEVYKIKNNRWDKIGNDIKGEKPGDEEGIVCINFDGSILATSATCNDENGKNSGHVRIFKNINCEWKQIGSNIVGDSIQDEFGYYVSLNSDGKIIGISSRWNDGNGQTSGQTRIFEFIENEWKQIGKDIYGENEFDQSGISISMSSDGKIIAIGAHGAINDKGLRTGHVRVFAYKSKE